MPAFAARAMSFAMSAGLLSSRKPAYGRRGCLCPAKRGFASFTNAHSPWDQLHLEENHSSPFAYRCQCG